MYNLQQRSTVACHRTNGALRVYWQQMFLSQKTFSMNRKTLSLFRAQHYHLLSKCCLYKKESEVETKFVLEHVN